MIPATLYYDNSQYLRNTRRNVLRSTDTAAKPKRKLRAKIKIRRAARQQETKMSTQAFRRSLPQDIPSGAIQRQHDGKQVEKVKDALLIGVIKPVKKLVDVKAEGERLLKTRPKGCEELENLKKRRVSKNPSVRNIVDELDRDNNLKMSTAEIKEYEKIAAQIENTSEPLPKLPDGDIAEEINTRSLALKSKDKDKILIFRQKGYIAILCLVKDLKVPEVIERLYAVFCEAIERVEKGVNRPCTALRKGYRKLIKGDGAKREYLTHEVVKRMTRAIPSKGLRDLQSQLRYTYLERIAAEKQVAYVQNMEQALKKQHAAVEEMANGLARPEGYGSQIMNGLTALEEFCQRSSATSTSGYYT